MTQPTWKLLEDSRRLRDESRVLTKDAIVTAKRSGEIMASSKELLEENEALCKFCLAGFA